MGSWAREQAPNNPIPSYPKSLLCPFPPFHIVKQRNTSNDWVKNIIIQNVDDDDNGTNKFYHYGKNDKSEDNNDSK